MRRFSLPVNRKTSIIDEDITNLDSRNSSMTELDEFGHLEIAIKELKEFTFWLEDILKSLKEKYNPDNNNLESKIILLKEETNKLINDIFSV